MTLPRLQLLDWIWLFLAGLGLLICCCGCGSCGLKVPGVDVSKLPQAPVVKPPAAKEPPKASSIEDQLDFHTDWLKWAASVDPKAMTQERIATVLEHAKDIEAIGPVVTAEEADHVKEIEIIQTSDEKAMGRTLVWAFGLAVVGILVGAILCFVVSKTLGGGILAGSGLACVAFYFMLGMLKMMQVFMWVGGAVLGLGVIVAIVELIRHRTAIVELVKSFEANKETSFAEMKPIINLIQSPGTQAVVSKVKAQLGIVSTSAQPSTTETPTPAAPSA